MGKGRRGRGGDPPLHTVAAQEKREAERGVQGREGRRQEGRASQDRGRERGRESHRNR